MHLFLVSGTAQQGAVEAFARAWHETYSVRFPAMPEFVRASFAADRASGRWVASAFWTARPDEERLREAIQELGMRIGPLLDGPPSAEWLDVLEEIG